MSSILDQRFADEGDSDEEDFHPASAAGSDVEGDTNGEEAVRPRVSRQPSQKSSGGSPAPNGHNGDVDEEDAGEDDEGEGEDLRDEEEELDSEEEDEEAISGRPRKRRKRAGLNQFIEEEAEVDEDDDAEDDDDDLGADGFVAEIHPDDLEQLPEGAERDDRRHRELDRRREMQESMDAEQAAQALKERYGRNRTTAQSTGAFIPQNLLMPSTDDPSIWDIKCKPGKERDIVHKISQKFKQRTGTRNPMRIFSVFERSGGGGTMAGRIFVEAKTKVDCDEALDGIQDVYPRTNPTLVAMKGMPDLLRVVQSKPLKRDDYVRIRRGLYQGDLAVIQDTEDNGVEVTLRLVPRLTYGMEEDDTKAPMITTNLGGDAKRKRNSAFGANNVAGRPPPRLFSEVEAKKKHSKFLQPNHGRKKSYNYKGDTYEAGFLIKDFKISMLITEGVNPRLDETTKLARIAIDGTETLDLESLAHSLRNNTADSSYMPGDEVEVFSGEQRGLTGRTESVTNNIVSIKVTEGDLNGQIVEVPMKGLRKRFKIGDQVKVVGGSRYKDDVGLVTQIQNESVTVLRNIDNVEITVFSKDLREATDSGGSSGASKFEVHELVQLDPATVACVIRAERESLKVLDQNGSVRTILPSQVANKIDPRKNAVATDRSGSEIRVGDTVKETAGENKSGAILHIHRSFLFVHNRTQIENSGIFTTRCINVATLAAKGGRVGTGPDLSKMNPALQMRNGANGAPMMPPKTFGRDRTIGKTVTIRKGPYKGMLGIVKDSTDTTARVELHSKSKVVNIDKDSLSIKDPLTGQTMDLRSFGGGGSGANRTPYSNGTPSRIPADWSGGRTPMAGGEGGRTPAWGAAASRTPAWSGASGGDSGRTPAWKPQSGAQTSYGGAGNMTSYGGAGTGGGSRTPAWSSSARTPYAGDHGFAAPSGPSSGFDAFAAGSRTPAYGAPAATGSRTPAWGGSPPGSYDAPTPGRTHEDYATPYGGAPTPAASAPTPDGGGGGHKNANKEPLRNNRFDAAPTPRYDAPTPAASGPTPAPYGGGYGADAPTPAGDGPRYFDSDED